MRISVCRSTVRCRTQPLGMTCTGYLVCSMQRQLVFQLRGRARVVAADATQQQYTCMVLEIGARDREMFGCRGSVKR